MSIGSQFVDDDKETKRVFSLGNLVPEVFLEPRKSREAARREKPLVTLDLILTLMQTPAVKRVKLIIAKGTNGDLVITRPLGITNQTNQ